MRGSCSRFVLTRDCVFAESVLLQSAIRVTNMCNRCLPEGPFRFVVLTAILTTLVVRGPQTHADVVARTQIVLSGTGTPAADPNRSGPATATGVTATRQIGD